MTPNNLYASFKDTISHWKTVILLVHFDPDFDAIGSALALGLQLQKEYNITPILWIEKPLSDIFEILPGQELITTTQPTIQPDAVCILDSSNPKRAFGTTEIFAQYPKLPTINLDHHMDNTLFGNIAIVENISSVCELLYALFEHYGWALTPQIATCLYAGIVFDTGSFQHSNVTPKTLLRASYLVENGAVPCEISRYVFEEKPLGYMQAIREALDHLIINKDLKYAYTWVNQDQEGYDLIQFLRVLKGVEVLVLFRKTADKIKVNLRSKGDFDVAAFAAQFGGGGHKKAAGLTLPNDLASQMNKVLSALDRMLSDPTK